MQVPRLHTRPTSVGLGCALRRTTLEWYSDTTPMQSHEMRVFE